MASCVLFLHVRMWISRVCWVVFVRWRFWMVMSCFGGMIMVARVGL